MSKVVVLGAGVMGLSAAYWASKNGHSVHVIEAAPVAGGMAAHFDLDGVSIERFYHFVCRTDYPTFELMQELGIAEKLHWRNTSMGLFHEGELHVWGNPLALFSCRSLTLMQKLRYALFAFVCVRRNTWNAIEDESAKTWIIRWCGKGIYERFWKSLLEYKFYEYADSISAAWIWTRIRRIGRSRRSMMQEELGYIEGGSETLVSALTGAIEANSGSIQLSRPAFQVTTEGLRVTGVLTSEGHISADAVISTIPTPLISSMFPCLPDSWRHRYAAIRNIAVICVIFKLRRSVTPHFWVNIAEPGVEMPGIIEFTNLRDVGRDSIVYVPYYMPVTNEKFSWSEDRLLSEAFACLQRVQPLLVLDDIVATKVTRLRHGQPICDPGFAAKIPPVQTPIEGLQIADTCFYYPEDRGIAESVRLGKAMAEALGVASVTNKEVPQTMPVETRTVA